MPYSNGTMGGRGKYSEFGRPVIFWGGWKDSDVERDWCWGYDRYGKPALSQTKMCTRNVLYMCDEARMCERGSK
jgi:hypothetical protein